MKLGKAALDGIETKHLLYAHSLLIANACCVLLCNIMLLIHSVVLRMCLSRFNENI